MNVREFGEWWVGINGDTLRGEYGFTPSDIKDKESFVVAVEHGYVDYQISFVPPSTDYIDLDSTPTVSYYDQLINTGENRYTEETNAFVTGKGVYINNREELITDYRGFILSSFDISSKNTYTELGYQLSLKGLHARNTYVYLQSL